MRKAKYSFSVITSTYNQLDQLKRLREHLNNQEFTDYDRIVADDGSNDGTDKWVKKNTDKYVFQHDFGYRLTKILNKAATEAEGEYLVWIMGDSYPQDDFLHMVDSHISPNTLASGIRINIDKKGKYHSHDWRIANIKDKLTEESLLVSGDNAYSSMTLNSMIMPTKMFNEMGGIHSGYDEGYGKMDWDMAAWAQYNGYDLKVFPKAIIYHDHHKERKDTDNNTKLFLERLEGFREVSDSNT
ncbi:MAG: hypothetical protein DRP09_10955 [Candidatus Thorarchaeota archaeon]|nr:MAG: hypothetical protein DRP09_10955 [Candidatus Thorarchaeota archaeon]